MKEEIRKEVMKVFNQEDNVDNVVDNILRLFDVIKSVCPKCKSDDWDSIGKNCRCNKCNKRWKQTVL